MKQNSFKEYEIQFKDEKEIIDNIIELLTNFY